MARDLEPAVESALRQVQNPSLGTDVYEAGLVHDLAVADGDVSVALDATAVDPSMARGVADAVVSAVGGVEGVDQVRVRQVTPTGGGGDAAMAHHGARHAHAHDHDGETTTEADAW